MLPIFLIGYGGYYYGIDWSYILLVLPTIIIALIAQMKVKSTYEKFSKVGSARGITGAAAARAILDAHGFSHVAIEPIAGQLTDNYNPKTNVVSLSQGVYGSTSIAAIGIAAHEVGHAIQHNTNYAPIRIRASLVPVVNFSSGISWIVILIGLLFSAQWLATIGLVLMSFSTLFHLVTLPVELNASKRAVEQIEHMNFGTTEEVQGIKKVLGAAAMTYVASLLTSVMTLLRFVLMVNRRNSR